MMAGMFRCLLLLAVLLAPPAIPTPTDAMTETYQLSNEFIFLRGEGGSFHELKLDAEGKGNHGPNLIRRLLIGDPIDHPRSFRLEQSEQQLIFRNLTVYLPVLIKQEEIGYPREIQADETAGIAFGSDFAFHRFEARFPTWQEHTSSVELTLYRIERLPRDGEEVSPLGSPLGTARIDQVRDNAWTSFQFGEFPPGFYYLEARRANGRLGWWGREQNVQPAMIGIENGRARERLDFTLRVHGAAAYEGTWFVSLQGRELASRFFPNAAARAAVLPGPWQTRIIMPWVQSGYALDEFPFERFYNSIGQHVFPHQLKRRPHSDQFRANRWTRAVGKHGADLLLEFSSLREFEGPPPLRWEMEPDSLHWLINETTLILRAEKTLPTLPPMFPRFVASDSRFAEDLTDFYLGHGLNWGANTASDWKEWDGLRLTWTGNPQALHHAHQLLHRPMTHEGYFWTWAGREKSYEDQIGWPFPFQDENGDGLNDKDTRHFVTNAVLISGSARHALWTRDVAFLKRALPRVRLAMEYQLNQLQGADGIILTNAAGRDGRNGSHGSNYWDILPFGHKDAYSNIYYYNSLLRMAEMEELSGLLLREEECATLDGPPARPAEWYRAHAGLVKSDYSDHFWDADAGRFIGCIDVDGNRHDYGFTFLNLEAAAYGLATPAQVERIYHWLENEPTSSGEADTYSRWVFAPRATTIHNPPPDGPQHPHPTWRFSGWAWGDWEVQCQDGGAILYTSAFDLIARSRYFGADNADQRLREILQRWSQPDRLMGGSPLFFGEITQGGPGGTAGQVGVEGEFPESGMVPASFLFTVIGLEAQPDGLHIRPHLPQSLEFAGVENLHYAGQLWNITVTANEVRIESASGDEWLRQRLTADEAAVFRPWEGRL
jgi:hypothetical protein